MSKKSIVIINNSSLQIKVIWGKDKLLFLKVNYYYNF